MSGRILKVLLGAILAAASIGPAGGYETPPGMQPLAIGCILQRAEPVDDAPGSVRVNGPRLDLHILVHVSSEYGKSQIVETDDPSGILSGKSFVRFDYIPGKPEKYALWTDADIQSNDNMMLQVDRSNPERPSAVLARRPDDPAFRYLGACFGLRSDDTYRDFERMKAQQS